MISVALTISLVLCQTETETEDPLEHSRAAIEGMRNLLRAVEHGMQEATDLGDARASECVRTGRLAMAHQVESAEEWNALLKDAVANADAELTARLLGRISAAQREVERRASELSTCKLSLEPPRPVVNRTWFFCDDQPASAQNPAWRSCERRRTSAVTFGLEGLLLAAPVIALSAASLRGLVVDDFGGLALESAVGGLIGGVIMFAASGAVALAVGGGLSQDNAGKVGIAVGACTALGVGTGAVFSMWLDRPTSGREAPWAASITYLAIAGISAVLIAMHHHFSVASTDDEEASLAEKSFAIAPVVMAVSAMLSVPAAWSYAAKR